MKLSHASPSSEKYLNIMWLLGNTCNYKCSYCPSMFHDRSSQWHAEDDIKNALLTIASQTDKQLYVCFLGGEPTACKHLPAILSFCKENNIKTRIISNMSRTIDYFEKLSPILDVVTASYHGEFVKDDGAFIEKVTMLASLIEVEVSVMIYPEIDIPRTEKLWANLKIIPKIFVSKTHTRPDYKQGLISGLETKLDFITNEKYIINLYPKGFNQYRGNMILKSQELSALKIPETMMLENDNIFKNWQCNIGVENLVVKLDGDIYRAFCHEGGALGNIKNINSFVLPKESIKCTKSHCVYGCDITATKWIQEGPQ